MRIIISAATAFLIMFLVSCDSGSSAQHYALRRGLSGEPSTLDPARAGDYFSMEVMRDVYEGLVAESPNGDVIPGIATNWKIDADGRHYIFTLRKDARWSNGRLIRAKDFVEGWRRVLDPKVASPVADDLRLIRGASEIISGNALLTSLAVEAIDDFTLTLELEHPAPYFLEILAHSSAYPIYSEASARSHQETSWVSNGPYVLHSWSPGTEIVLTKNKWYWDRTNVAIPEIHFDFIPDEVSQYARYRANQLDLTDSVPPNAAESLRREHPYELKISPFLATAYYGLNMAIGPFKSNIKLRQALAMAIDRKRLVASLQYGQAPAYGFVPQGTLNYRPQAWTWKTLNDVDRIASAKDLYQQAGYSEKTPLHLRLIYNSNPVIKNMAIASAAMWHEVLGVDVELADEEYRVFLQTRLDKTRWDIGRFAWTADYNDASNFLEIFRHNSPNNEEGYFNNMFDKVLESADSVPEPKIRQAMLEEGERKLLSDYPIIPLYFFVSKRLVKPYLHGFQMNALNHITSKSLQFSSP